MKHFDPVHLKHANKKLDMHIHKETNDTHKKDILKESLWKKLVGLFK